MNQIDKIWELRVKLANAERRKSQARHFITNHPFYLDDMDYWREVRGLAEKRLSISSLSQEDGYKNLQVL
jgi:hypothetical protein